MRSCAIQCCNNTQLSSLELGFPPTGQASNSQGTALRMDSTKSEDADIDTAFTRYASAEHDVDDPPSSPDSEGGNRHVH